MYTKQNATNFRKKKCSLLLNANMHVSCFNTAEIKAFQEVTNMIGMKRPSG